MATIIVLGTGLHILNSLMHNLKECSPDPQGPKGDVVLQGPKGDAGPQGPRGPQVSKSNVSPQVRIPQKPKSVTVLEDVIMKHLR
jgi:hypothetical protein